MTLLVGALSVALTGLVVQRHFGRAPQLVPLLTARFLGDGPGMAYLKAHCPQSGFAACAYRDRPSINTQVFLWSTKPGEGIFLLAPPAERSAIAAQDQAFAWAVLRAYPLDQGMIILRNAGRQLVTFDSTLLNAGCDAGWPCSLALPPVERARLARSLGGRDLWPQAALTVLHYVVVSIAVVLLGAWIAIGRRQNSDARSRDLLLWIGLLSVVMLVNALLGGAVSEPQTRYQARLIWLVPFFALLAAMLWRQTTVIPGDDKEL